MANGVELKASYTLQKTGLRPVGSRRVKVFHVGESGLAARTAVAGDELADELVNNLSEDGASHFDSVLYARGLEYGEISTEGERVSAGRTWLLYPAGKSAEAWAEIGQELG